MPTPKLRFYLHSKAAADGRRPVYLSVGVGETRPVRQATGVVVSPAYFSADAPHILKGADGYRQHNERLDELRLLAGKLCRRLEDDGQLDNEHLAPLLKQAVADLTGQATRAVAPKASPTPKPAQLPLAEQPLRAVLQAWQQENRAEMAATYLNKASQYVDWFEKFDPDATPATVNAKWVKRYTSYLVHDTPLFNNTIHQHLNCLRALLQQAGLNTKWLKNKWKHKAEKCFLTLEELERLVAWQPPATKPSLGRQKDVFVARCLCGLRYSDAAALLRPHIRAGQTANMIKLDQQKTRSAVQIPVVAMLQQLLDRYAHLPAGKALPIISRQHTGAMIKEMLREAGITAPYVRVRYKGTVKHEEVMPKWQAASTHTARHTYGMLLATKKVDPLTMRDLMGHSDLKSTMDYVHLAGEATERTVLDALGSIGQGAL
jgi:integrase